MEARLATMYSLNPDLLHQVNVRTRDNVVHGSKTIPELLIELAQAVADFQ